MKYFENFYSLPYTFDPNRKNFFNVKNIFTRVKMLDSIINNVSIYYTYQMKDTDSIEGISYKYYGDIQKYWIILFTNQILDPFFDLPLKYEQFREYVATKYGSLEAAQQILHHYEKRQVNTATFNGTIKTSESIANYSNTIYSIDGVTSLPTVENPVYAPPSPADTIVDGMTVSTAIELVAVSAYDAENSINEEKRKIKLIKKDYAAQVESELRNLLKNPY